MARTIGKQFVAYALQSICEALAVLRSHPVIALVEATRPLPIVSGGSAAGAVRR